MPRKAATAVSSRSGWLSTPTTIAPSRAMISAVARPIPLANAVMNATLSLNRMVPPSRLRYSQAETSTGERAMQLGIHLPHAGEQASPDKIRDAAMRAEELGLDDVWVSEHI